MATRTVTGRIYDENGAAWASQPVVFNLLTDFSTTSSETVLNKTYTLTTDGSGDFTAALAVPDSDAWQYSCSLPDKTSFIFNLQAGSATTLRAILADQNLSATVSASDIDTLVDAHASLTSGIHGVTGDVVGTSDSQTVTNKTINYNDNTITNLPAAGLHASDHVDGTDDIQNATSGQKGLATAAQITKLDGIEALADVTDTANVTSSGALMTSGGTMAGDIAMADNSITRPVFKDYGEDMETDATSTATKTLDIAAEGNVFDITLTAGCTFTFSNPSASGTACSFTLICRQDPTGSRLVTWPASVDWASATAPTLSTGANDVDVFTFLTVDAGTTWLGFTAGLDLS